MFTLQLLNGDKDLITQIYTEGAGGVNDILLQRYAGGFDKAVKQVFPKNSELSDKFRINASRLGAYKTYDLCRELEKARGLTPVEFQKFATARMGAYNAFQRTECNTLVARARTAKQFTQFEKDADLYPNLEWLATRSATPRAEHLGYVGLILPIDDPFWSHNQPGNEYNCKCDWRQTNKPATGTPKTVTPPAKGLEGNPAQTGELVTERHPYFKRNADAPEWVNDKAILQCPDEVCFIEKTTPGGKTFLEHRLVDRELEAVGNRAITELLADNGYKDIRLLPIIDRREPVLRARYYGKNFQSITKCPDAAIGDIMVEYKKSNRTNISKNIGAAARKSNIAVIKIKTGNIVSETHIDTVVNRQWKIENRKNLTEIIIINNDKLLSFKRKTGN